MMAEDGLETLKPFDAIYFGAVGWQNVPDHISLWGLRLNITQNFDQWANVRPVKFLPGVRQPAAQGRRHRARLGRRPGEQRGRVRRLRRPQPLRPRPGQRGRPADRPVHREGLRADHPVRVRPGPHPHASRRSPASPSPTPSSTAWCCGTRSSTGSPLDYPDVATESVLVDAMSAKFVLKPEDLSVVVASNLNADILSDLGSALAGSLGLAASANLNPERRFPSMFEPVHGSAPDIAGQGICNPIGAIASRRADAATTSACDDEADRARSRHRDVTGAGVLTRDIGGTASHRRGHRRHRGRPAEGSAAGLSPPAVWSDLPGVGRTRCPQPRPPAARSWVTAQPPGLLAAAVALVAAFHNEVGIMHAYPDAPVDRRPSRNRGTANCTSGS